MAYAIETHGFGANLAHRFTTFSADLAAAAAKRKMYRTTLRELSSLSDRDLADLGLGRTMIHSIAFEAAYGTKS